LDDLTTKVLGGGEPVSFTEEEWLLKNDAANVVLSARIRT
jgi:hypothetical protein